MKPDDLRKLVSEATTAESWDGLREGYLVDEPGEGWERPEPIERLIALAPDLALLVADMADDLNAQWDAMSEEMRRNAPALADLLARLDVLMEEK